MPPYGLGCLLQLGLGTRNRGKCAAEVTRSRIGTARRAWAGPPAHRPDLAASASAATIARSAGRSDARSTRTDRPWRIQGYVPSAMRLRTDAGEPYPSRTNSATVTSREGLATRRASISARSSRISLASGATAAPTTSDKTASRVKACASIVREPRGLRRAWPDGRAGHHAIAGSCAVQGKARAVCGRVQVALAAPQLRRLPTVWGLSNFFVAAVPYGTVFVKIAPLKMRGTRGSWARIVPLAFENA